MLKNPGFMIHLIKDQKLPTTGTLSKCAESHNCLDIDREAPVEHPWNCV